jgi:phage major head subunit gpT-like protein
MIINHSSLATLRRVYNAAFKNGFSRVTPDWTQIATRIPSGSESNIYAFLGQFPRLREWLGDRQVKDLAAHAYTVTNKPFEATVGVDRDAIEDDTYGVYSTLMEEMGYSAALHPDEIIFAALAAGITDLCYDGQAFFDTDHPTYDGNTASNYDSTGSGNLWFLLDTRHPLKPMILQNRKEYAFQALTNPTDENVFMRKKFLYGVDGRSAPAYGLWQFAYASNDTLNSTNFDTYVTNMMNLKSDEEKPLGARPNLLVCGPSNRAAARNLIEVQFLAGGANNPNYKEVDVLVSPHLT